MDRHFHPFGLGVCTNEKTEDFEFIFQCILVGLRLLKLEPRTDYVLISDAADAIRNAFDSIFGEDSEKVMCWAHMRRCVDHRLNLVEEEDRKAIMDDIDSIQLSCNPDVFEYSVKLFKKKWQKYEEFLKYFDNEWLTDKSSWYEGYALKCPSTNNALERLNLGLKTHETFRERLPLSRFCNLALKIVSNWSRDRQESSLDPKIYKSEPTIDLTTWTAAYNWLKFNKNILSKSEVDKTIFYVPASDTISVTDKMIERYYKRNFKSFDTFKDAQTSIWVVEMPMDSNKWKEATCTCPVNLKTFICKHVVGIACRLKFCKIPPNAKDVAVGEKRKRGRVPKATKALLKD